MHYFQFNIGDYMKHTARLTLMEDLAYRRMLDLYYLNDGPLCSDTKRLAKQIGMAGEEDAIAFVLSEFFTLDGDVYRNSRADKEITSYAEKAEKSRLNGRNGGRPRTGQQPSNNPEETQQVISGNPEESERKGNHKPLTINQEPITIEEIKEPLSDKSDDSVKRVIDLLNSLTGSKYRASTKSHSANISGRLNDGHSVDDLLDVVRFKCGEWLHDPKMAQYLRPETLFQAGKFNGYLTAARAAQSPLAEMSAISRKNAQNLAGDW